MVSAGAARDFLARTGALYPVVQAPMAGAGGVELAVAAIGAGAIGSLPCALLTPETIVAQASEVRARATGPLNLNFFTHTLPPPPDEAAWRAALAPFYAAERVVPPTEAPPLRRPFDDAACDAVEWARPAIVSFHFGLPEAALLVRVRATGAAVWGNATTIAEARYLAEAGCDAIIVQGFEAGGHAGHFLHGYRPVGLAALLPQVVAATALPVIAAGGITMESISSLFALGAAAVQVGTAYLATPESLISAPHRALLGTRDAEETVVTNLFSGGLARGFPNALTHAFGPVSDLAPPYPYATAALAPLRAKAEADGRGDYSPMWAGQSAATARTMPAADLTQALGKAALAAMERRA